MKIAPLAAPSSSTPVSTPVADGRARAIASLNAAMNANAQPVPNATSISPEEMGAIRQSSSGSQDNGDPSATAMSEVPETKAKEDPLSSHYATLARKEKALRAQVQQFNAEKAKFESERTNQPKQQEIDLSKYIDRERLKADPLSAFEEAGLSYDDLTEQVLARQSMNTDPRILRQMAQMQEQIKAAQDELKATKDAQAEGQQQSYQQAVNQIRGEASKLVFTDPAYEMIKTTNSISDVVELIEATFKEEGTLMTVEEACQQVEDHLLEEAIKLTKIGKLQQRLSQSTAKPATDTKQPQQTGSKTLTNTMSTQPRMSARERAILAAEGKLNKQ